MVFKVKTSGRYMGITIGVMLEEVQSLYQQHNQSCFLYLSSEVIKVWFFFCYDWFYIIFHLCCFYWWHLNWQIFGSDPSCANYLQSLIAALFSHTTKLLMTIKVIRFHTAVLSSMSIRSLICYVFLKQLLINLHFPLSCRILQQDLI